MGQRAVSQGMDKAVDSGVPKFQETVDGLDFQVYFDLETREIKNVFPIMERTE